MIPDARALATRLAARDDAALAETFAARAVAPTAPWHDFFDAAEALLDAASVDRALSRLDRAALISLATGTSPAGSATTLLLADETGRAYAPVAERIEAARVSNPEAFVPTPDDEVPEAGQRAAAAAAERAFSTAGSLADILLACLHTPLVRTGTGTVSAADRKRLTEDGALASPDDLEDLLLAAAASRLAAPREREWIVTEAGERWLRIATGERWAAIVDGFRAALPEGLRTPGGGILPLPAWHDAYPLDASWPDRARRLQRIGWMWGLFDDDGAEFAWTASLRRGEPADATAMAAYLPAEIDRVYLQADLTAIAPGPLAPALDLRLRAIAHRESRAQASTYRFTPETLGAGMTEGETAESIRGFLAELSLTGIPQPLEYLIESTAARHGLIRVRSDIVSGRTLVESSDPAALDTIAVDQALRPLGLLADGGVLTSRVARDAVYWTLADARYPVVVVDDAGAPVAVNRRAGTFAGDPEETPAERYARLIRMLRSGHGTDGEDAWLGRELEQAVRARAEIVVVVRMPDGSERSLTLEAAGLGGGRLRGRDRAADIERTLPVSSIVSVRPR